VLSEFISQLKEIASNPKYTLMRNFARFNLLRYLIAKLHHQDFTDLPGSSARSIFPELNIREIIDSMEKDGCYIGLQLPVNIVKCLVDVAKSSVCYGNRNPVQGFLYKDRAIVLAQNPDFLLASFYNLHSLYPAIKSIEEDPQILKIAAHYLKSRPVFQGINMWWSFANTTSQKYRGTAGQLYHTDLDDYQFIKFFFYLTDVDECGGPHAIMKGTHNNKKFRHQFKLGQFSDQEIFDEYGADRAIILYGSAGYGFIEDTQCFHKAYPPYNQDRLILQVLFGLRDYGVQHTDIDPKKLKTINLHLVNTGH
jgi:hypothetical protein